jgi:hypothetical protein
MKKLGFGESASLFGGHELGITMGRKWLQERPVGAIRE